MAENETRRKMQHAVSQAAAGADGFAWLDELIREAGYVRPDVGYRQNELTEALPRLTRATLRNWEADGLPCTKVGRAKHYPLNAFLAWLYDRAVRAGRPAGDDELVAYRKHDAKYKAKLRELEYLRETGELIDRADAEATLVAVVAQVQTSILGLPGTLAPQLEHRPASEIRKTLEKYLKWLCNEMANGRVPMPAEAKAELAAFLKRLG